MDFQPFSTALRQALILLGLGALAGCGSFPKAEPWTLPPAILTGVSDRVVFLPECQVDCPVDAVRVHNSQLVDLYNTLVSADIFLEVSIGGESGARPGDYVIDLHDRPRRPYWSTPGHNPGFLILSLVIPFWWNEPLGFRFSIREHPDGEWQLIDTRWEGTVIMWSLSPLINLLPGRSYFSPYTQVRNRLRRALLGEHE